MHQPTQAKTIEEVPKTISSWKGLRREFEELSGETVNPEEERHLILQMCPSNLQEKLLDKWEHLTSSQSIEYEIVKIMDMRQDISRNGRPIHGVFGEPTEDRRDGGE